MSDRKTIYYLESIARNLKEFSTVAGDFGPSIGTEVLADNRDWLDCYIDELKRRRPSDDRVTDGDTGTGA
jgi:hypothetical protein